MPFAVRKPYDKKIKTKSGTKTVHVKSKVIKTTKGRKKK